MTGIEIRQGEDCTIEIPNVRDASGALVLPTQVSAIKAQIRTVVNPFLAPNPLHEWSLAANNVEMITGKVTLLVAAAVSSAWTWRFGLYDVKLIDTAGKIGWIGQGYVTLLPQTTI